jgi:hypothetical protein
MKRKDYLAGALCAATLIGMSVLMLAQPRFTHVQGQYDGEVRSARSGTTYKPFQTLELELPDGRIFWVPVRASDVYRVGDKVHVRIACTSADFTQCTAQPWARN